jgi:hypothetical protein
VYGAVTLYGVSFQALPLPSSFVTLWGSDDSPIISHYPILATPSGYHTNMVWASPRSLAATDGVVVTFLSSGYLDVSVPLVPSTRPMCSGGSNTP